MRVQTATAIELLTSIPVAGAVARASERASRAYAALVAELMKLRDKEIISPPAAPVAEKSRPKPQHRETVYRGKVAR